ncbi:LysR family transcriptional regulator [Xanthomonas arboricola]|uniref:LysR family transcriptional regulator n=2 Tax=Xanthomonas arboricola TaxID=56448 RepID=UPI003CCF213D
MSVSRNRVQVPRSRLPYICNSVAIRCQNHQRLVRNCTNGCAMDDLNDLAYFASVVRHGGFSAAARASGIEKTRLSRRVAALEDALGGACCSEPHAASP